MQKKIKYRMFRFGRKRVRVYPHEHPRFCLPDVCHCLDQRHAGNSAHLVAEEFQVTLEKHPADTKNGTRHLNFVTLEQLQCVIDHARSEKKTAFAEWLNTDVLPKLMPQEKAEEPAAPSETPPTAPRFTQADIDFIIEVVSENFNVSMKLL